MKKFLALILAVMMFASLTACGGEVAEDASGSSAVVADNAGTGITDEQVKGLTEVYNQIAPLYNDVYVAAEKNGWLNDELTATELQSVGGTMNVIATALTEDMSMLAGADVDALIETLGQLVPELEKMAQRVAVPFVAG